MDTWLIRRSVELTEPQGAVYVPSAVLSGDSMGHMIVLTVKKNGEAADLTGAEA